MPDFTKLAFVLFLGVISCDHIKCQDDTSRTSMQIRLNTEQVLGLDDLLVNGKMYIPEHAYVTGSPEFEYRKGTKSTLYIKGQSFKNLNLSYDIVSDQLILNLSEGNGFGNRILLHPAHIDSFYLGSHLFINPVNGKGYFEQLNTGREIFLKKHSKVYIKIYDASNRGKYSPQKLTRYVMNDRGELFMVNSRRAFLRYYSPHRKNLREYLRRENINYRKASNQELKNLMIYSYELSHKVR
jgi:hypothetical protein